MVTPIFTKGALDLRFSVTKLIHGIKYPKLRPAVNLVDVTGSAYDDTGEADLDYLAEVAQWHMIPYVKDVARIMVAETYLSVDFYQNLTDDDGMPVEYDEDMIKAFLNLKVLENAKVSGLDVDDESTFVNLNPLDIICKSLAKKMMEMCVDSCQGGKKNRGDMASLILANYEMLGITDVVYWLGEYIRNAILGQHDADEGDGSSIDTDTVVEATVAKTKMREPKVLLAELRSVLVDCLQVDAGFLEVFFGSRVMSRRGVITILCQPNRRDMVIALIEELKQLGSRALLMLVDALKVTDQSDLANIVYKKINNEI